MPETTISIRLLTPLAPHSQTPTINTPFVRLINNNNRVLGQMKITFNLLHENTIRHKQNLRSISLITLIPNLMRHDRTLLLTISVKTQLFTNPVGHRRSSNSSRFGDPYFLSITSETRFKQKLWNLRCFTGPCFSTDDCDRVFADFFHYGLFFVADW